MEKSYGMAERIFLVSKKRRRSWYVKKCISEELAENQGKRKGIVGQIL